MLAWDEHSGMAEAGADSYKASDSRNKADNWPEVYWAPAEKQVAVEAPAGKQVAVEVPVETQLHLMPEEQPQQILPPVPVLSVQKFDYC